jgi:NADH-quinone oxidoreductase subunit N
MLIASFFRNHKLISGLSLLGLVLAFVSLFNISQNLPVWAEKLIVIDQFAIFFMAIALAAAILINIISYNYFSKFQEQKEEFYILFNIAVLGTLVMISAHHFIAFFIGLELLSIPLYVLIAYTRTNKGSVEAAIKYLTLAAASSAILLFGMAMLYGVCGSMDTTVVSLYFRITHPLPPLALAGLSLIIVALGFKLALAPFHMWTPDVYQGAPSPVTAFLASASKGAAFAFALRLIAGTGIQSSGILYVVLAIISVLSMFTGNLLALKQTSIKRILASSSVANLGYLLIALIVGGSMGLKSASFYLAAYFLTTVGAFTVIGILSNEEKEADSLENYKGLYFRNKWLAIILAATFFSLAGMPLTAGFISKFYLATGAASASKWLLIWLLIINSAISLYYYLKVVYTIFKPSESEQLQGKIFVPIASSLVLAISFISIIWLGVAPAGLMKIIEMVVK